MANGETLDSLLARSLRNSVGEGLAGRVPQDAATTNVQPHGGGWVLQRPANIAEMVTGDGQDPSWPRLAAYLSMRSTARGVHGRDRQRLTLARRDAGVDEARSNNGLGDDRGARIQSDMEIARAPSSFYGCDKSRTAPTTSSASTIFETT